MKTQPLWALLMTCLLGGSARGDLIVNGSFEDPVVSYFEVFDSIPGWTTTFGPGIELQNGVLPAFHGDQVVELASYDNSGMRQEVLTTPGQRYQLGFAYSPRPNIPPEGNRIEVLVDGEWLATVTGDGAGRSGTQWTNHVLVVTARSSRTALEFRAAGQGGDPSFGGLLDDVRLTAVGGPPGSRLWEFATGGPVYSSPALGADGTVYVGSDDQSVYALNGATGTKVWQFRTGGPVRSSPALANDGTVYVGSDRSWALNGLTGANTWECALRGPVSASPSIGRDGAVYVGMGDTLYALHGTTREVLWQRCFTQDIENPIRPALSVSLGRDGTVYVVTVGSGEYYTMWALDWATGILRRGFLSGQRSFAAPAFGPDGAVVAASNGGVVCYAEPLTGVQRWETITGLGLRGSPTISADGSVYVGVDVGTTGGACWALDLVTGVRRWQFLTGGGGTTPALTADGTVYVGSSDKRFYALVGTTGTVRWEFVAGGGIGSSPVIGTDGTVYFGCDDGKVYALYGESPLADAPWPMLSGNPRHTGSAEPADELGHRPSVIRQPQDAVVVARGNVAFAVTATGTAPLAYAWRKDEALLVEGGRVAGVNAAQLSLTTVVASDAGRYDVVVTNRFGSVTSRRAVLTVSNDWLGQPLWGFPTGGSVFSSPALGADGTVYIASYDHKVYALDGATGGKRWEFATGGWVCSSPALGADGTVYVGSGDQRVYALDAVTGAKRWEFVTGGRVKSSPAIGADGTVYAGSVEGKVYAVNGVTGLKRWEFPTGGPVYSSPVIGADGTVYAGSSGGEVYAVDGLTGQKRWQSWTQPAQYLAPAVQAIGADGTVYVIQNGVYALNGATGQRVWVSTNLDQADSVAIGADGTVYVGALGSLHALNWATGEERWAFAVEGYVGSAPAIGADGILYVTSGREWSSVPNNEDPGTCVLHALDTVTGREVWSWRQAIRQTGSSPTIGVDGTVYFGSSDGNLYALTSSSVGGLAVSPWPKFRGNAQNTGRVGAGEPGKPPTLVLEPGDATVVVRANIAFVVAATGTAPLGYSWCKDDAVLVEGSRIAGVNTARLSLTNVLASDAGLYRVVVTNAFGSVTSRSAVLTVTGHVPGQKLWEFAAGAAIHSSPAIGADGTVYVGSGWEARRLYALKGATGDKLWEFKTGSGVRSSPAIGADGTVYVGSGWEDNRLYALNGATGDKLWEFKTGQGVESGPGIGVDGTVYVGSHDGKVYALTGATGQKLWEFGTGNWVDSSPATGAEGTVYVGSTDGKLYALNPATGRPRWVFRTGSMGFSSAALGAGGTVYVGSNDEKVYALNGETGQKRWEFLTGREVASSPAIGADGTVYVGSNDKKVYALDGETGQKRWEFLTGGEVASSPAIGADGTVYVGSNDKKLYALDGETGQKRWEFATGGGVTCSPAIGADGTVYVGSADGRLYALTSSSTGGLAASPWPKFRANALNTGRGGGGEPGRPPTVVVEPENQRAVVGGTVVFAVTARGALPLDYQWYKDGEALRETARIQGVNCSRLEIRNLFATDAGQYTVGVSNGLGATTSRGAILTVSAAQPGDLRWVFQTGDEVIACPAIAKDGTVYVASVDRKLYALDGATGQKVWEFLSGGPMYSAPAIAADGTVYVGSMDGSVYALNGATGQKRWAHEVGRLIMGCCPAIGADGTVYVGSDDAKFYALDGATGRRLWEYNEAWVKSSPAVGADGTVYVASMDGKVHALNGATGQKRWEYRTGGSVEFSSPAIGADGTVYLGTVEEGKVYALDGATGQRTWVFETFNDVRSSPAIGEDGTVYIGSFNKGVYALNGVTGQRRWVYRTDGEVFSSPAIGADGTVYVGSRGLHALDAATGEQRWSFWLDTGSPEALTLGAGGTVYVGWSDGKVTALHGSSGLAASPWPKFHRDAQNTGRAGAAEPGQPPTIVVEPEDATVVVDAAVAFGVTAKGTPPLRYQWRKDEAVLVEGGRITGVHTARLSLTNVLASDAGLYRVVISNAFGSVTSRSAVLTVTGHPPSQKLWEFAASGPISSCPAIGDDGTVYVGLNDRDVYALDAATGATRWVFRTDLKGVSTVALGAGGELFVAYYDRVYALDVATGEARWESVTGGGDRPSAPAVGADGTVYVHSGDGQLYALAGADGQHRWVVPIEVGSVAGPASAPAIGNDGTVYVGSWRNAKVVAIRGATAMKIWEFLTDGPVGAEPAVGADGTVYVGSQGGKLYALDGATGQKRWEFGTSGPVLSSVAIGVNGTVFVGGSWPDTRVYALSGATGTKVWEFATGGSVSSPAIGADGTVYVGSSERRLYALDGATGTKRWEYQQGGVFSPAIGPDGTLYVGSAISVGGFDGKLYALSSSSVGGLAASPWPKFRGDASNTGRVRASPAAKVVQWSVNGHWYERVDAGQLSWTAARAAAEQRTHEGMRGHLVTVSSAEENRFVSEHAALGQGTGALLEQYWLGGFQPAGSAEPAGDWRWVTEEPFDYANWGSGEPNDGWGKEDALMFWGPPTADGKAWNDGIGPDEGYGQGYVVEYEAARPEDRTPPILTGVQGDSLRTRVTLRFSEALAAATAIDPANYALSGGLQVQGVRMGIDGATVILSTSLQTSETAYTVTVNNVADLAGNRIASDSEATFTAQGLFTLGQFTFGNRILAAGIDAKVFLSCSTTPLDGSAYRAQAYVKQAGDPDDLYVAVGEPVPFRTGASAGYITSTAVTTPFPAGTVIEVEMRAWEAARGGTWEAAVTNHGIYGISYPVTLSVTAPPDPPADMVGLQGWCNLAGQPRTPPPRIVRQPDDVRVAVNHPFVLSAAAAYAAPDAWRWYRDGQPLGGNNDGVLSVARAQLTHTGLYQVTVTNQLGAATSRVARVVVGYPLTLAPHGVGRIEVQPAVNVFAPGETAELRAVPGEGRTFLGWGGDVSGIANPLTLTIDGVRSIVARFSLVPGDERWHYAGGAPRLSAPAIGADGTLYLACGLSNVCALEPATGQEIWRYETGGYVSAPPAVGAGGTVLAGSSDGRIYALEGTTGALQWVYETGNAVESAPVIGADGTVYVGCSNLLGQATVTALDGAQGTPRWEHATGSQGGASLAIGADGTIYVRAGTNLFALEGSSGTRRWAFASPGGMTADPALGDDGTVYARSGEGLLYALEGRTGVARAGWRPPVVEYGPSGPVIGFEDTLLIPGGSGVSAFSALTGIAQWRFLATDGVYATPAVASDGTVYVAGATGTVYALDSRTGVERWRFETRAWLDAPLAIGADGTVYVAAGDGVLYALQGSTGLAGTPWPKFHQDAQNTGRGRGEPPEILRQPVRTVLREAAEGRISVRLSGLPPPRARWFFNDVAVPDGTNATLVLPTVTREFEGFYRLVASNALGQATSAPIVAIVSNVDPHRFPGWRWEGVGVEGGNVQAQMAPSPVAPWQGFGEFPAGATAGYYVETNVVDAVRCYRLRTVAGDTRFTACTLVPGWWYEAENGSRHRIEYVWSGSGWTNWVALPELTLPASPHLFLDTDAFDHPDAVYRTTPLR
ncbi:MAG: PQQ-binding-like beta-propeller repeat protein [Verrucomicrobiales bacterium]|nr:PQQ-binding-like beta-propeller repeat protein [Verrucomicrobiales bacterium]